MCGEDNSINVVDNVIEEDKDNVIVLEERKVAKCDENRVETQLGKTSLDDLDKLGNYDVSLIMPIALRKGTRSWMKHSMCNYIS